MCPRSRRYHDRQPNADVRQPEIYRQCGPDELKWYWFVTVEVGNLSAGLSLPDVNSTLGLSSCSNETPHQETKRRQLPSHYRVASGEKRCPGLSTSKSAPPPQPTNR